MNSLSIFSGAAAPVPAHIAGFLDQAETNIVERNRVPTLNYGGKVWSIALPDGTKTNLTRRNDDGDTEPVQTLRVVVLDYAKHRGRTYYEGAYDPEKIGAPTCWSDDGERPNAQVTEPKAATCRSCPLSVKGSKITEAGKQVTACSQHRNVVVLPVIGNMALPPLKLKLAITSLFDKQSPELEKEGWRAFENYLDFLRGNGAKHTATIVTKMKFDPSANYPKVIFSAERWLEPAELETVTARMSDGSVEALLALDATAEEAESAPAIAAPVAPAAPVAVAPVAPVASVAVAPVAPAAPVVTPAPARRPAKPAPAAPPAAQDDNDQIEMDLSPAPAAPAAPAAAETTAVPQELQDLLAEWDD